MSLLSQSCHEAARLMSDAQDAPLSLTARIGLRLHLAICSQCRRYHRHLEFLRSTLAQMPEHLSKERLPDDRRQQIVAELTRQ